MLHRLLCHLGCHLWHYGVDFHLRQCCCCGACDVRDEFDYFWRRMARRVPSRGDG
jgi:hypothetical protein